MSKRKKQIRKPRFIRFAHERNLEPEELVSSAGADEVERSAPPAAAAPEHPVLLEPVVDIQLDHAEDPVGIAEETAGDAPELEEVDAVPQVITACKKRQGEWWLFTMDANGDFQPTDGPFDDRETCESMRPDKDTNMTDRLP